MRDRKQRYLHIERGRTLHQFFRIVNPITFVPYDFHAIGYNRGILQVRTATLDDGGVLLFDLTTENGGISLDYIANDGTGKAWSGYIYASNETTAGLQAAQDAIYEFVLIHDDGTHSTLSRGPVLLIPPVVEL